MKNLTRTREDRVAMAKVSANNKASRRSREMEFGCDVIMVKRGEEPSAKLLAAWKKEGLTVRYY